MTLALSLSCYRRLAPFSHLQKLPDSTRLFSSEFRQGCSLRPAGITSRSKEAKFRSLGPDFSFSPSPSGRRSRSADTDPDDLRTICCRGARTEARSHDSRRCATARGHRKPSERMTSCTTRSVCCQTTGVNSVPRRGQG